MTGDVIQIMPISNAFKIIEAQLNQVSGNLEQAIKINLEILNSKEQDPIALGNIAQIYQTEGRNEELTKLLKKLANSSHTDSTMIPKIVLTSLNMELNDLSHQFCTVFEKKTNDENALTALRAHIFLKENNYQKAYELSRTYLSVFQNDLQSLATYTQASICLDKIENAWQATKLARSLAPLNQYWIALEATIERLRNKDHSFLYNYKKFVRSFQLYKSSEREARQLQTLSEFLDSMHLSKNEPIDQSLRSGTQTTQDLRYIDHPAVSEFWTKISPFVSTYLKDIGNDPDHPFLARKSKNYRPSGAWSVKLRGNGYHANHVHPQGWISGAFYLQVPDEINGERKSGWLKLGEPSFKHPDLDAEHFVKPSPGKMVLFPSYMWHGTIPIHHNSKRMTLSFDLVPSLT